MGGVCVCGECLCPDCVTDDADDLCKSACCDVSSKQCTISDKRVTAAPLGCVPANPDPCTAYTCQASTGECVVNTTCAGNCGCASVAPCSVNLLDPAACSAECNAQPIECGCGNLCGSTCDAETGFCGGAKDCNDDNSCTVDTCVVRSIGSPAKPTAVCINQDVSASLCPLGNECSFSVCVGNDTEPVCVVETIGSLLDLCGTCNGDNNGCSFQQTSVAVGTIVGAAFAAGFVIAASLAAIAAVKANKKSKAAGSNPLQDQALMDNPTFKTPGLDGSMPAL